MVIYMKRCNQIIGYEHSATLRREHKCLHPISRHKVRKQLTNVRTMTKFKTKGEGTGFWNKLRLVNP
jgi:hypothetical protein